MSRCKGFAHIEFNDSDSAAKALGVAGTTVDGRAIRVDTSTKRSDSAGGFRGGRGGRGGSFGGGFRGGRDDYAQGNKNETFEF